MSILIKGMAMPKDQLYPVHATIYADGTVFTGHGIGQTAKEAVPVPPHGRLVDADKLGIRDAEKQAYEAYLREKGEDFIEEPVIEYHRGYLEGLTHASGLVRFAPTIIPAEEGRT